MSVAPVTLVDVNMEEIQEALTFANFCHTYLAKTLDKVHRKNGGGAYIIHPMRVLLKAMTRPGFTTITGKTIGCHDVMEDTRCTPEQLIAKIGESAAIGVFALTNLSQKPPFNNLPRSQRKTMDREELAKQPDWIREIKLLDRIDNLEDMLPQPGIHGLLFGRDFILTYCEESLLLSKAIGAEFPDLTERISQLCAYLEQQTALAT
jgi:(p)ppGpp synthase/HD superfamily hydrolase